jgi:predicted phage tail protein
VVTVSAGESEKAVKNGFGIVAEKDKPLPEPVQLLSPPEITITQPADRTQVTVTWKALYGAKHYRYQIASDEKFNKMLLDATTRENVIKINTLSPSNYYLRIRGVDQFKLEGFDATAAVEIKQAPPPPPVEDDSYWKIIMSVGLLILVL